MINWIQQQDSRGCVIAALAMITGKTYEEVRDDITVFIGSGLTSFEADQYLVEHGFAVARKYKHILYNKSDREIWPPEPWMDMHLCFVWPQKTGRGCHAVVMLKDGTVLDPDTSETKRLNDYYKVDNVTGVVKV